MRKEEKLREEIQYPRKPGEDKAVLREDWIKDCPSGHCPTYGSVGMEVAPSRESDSVQFDCSDKTCLTTYSITKDPSGGVEGVNRTFCTSWFEEKSSDWRETERQGTSWNWTHFSPEFCQEHDLV